jgi:hypothetical protein
MHQLRLPEWAGEQQLRAISLGIDFPHLVLALLCMAGDGDENLADDDAAGTII